MESDRCAIQHDPTNSVVIVSWYEREPGSIVSVMNPASTMATTARIAVTVREYTAGAFNDTVQERPEPQPMSVHIRKMIAMIPPMAKCSVSWYPRCMVRASTVVGDAAAATNMPAWIHWHLLSLLTKNRRWLLSVNERQTPTTYFMGVL